MNVFNPYAEDIHAYLKTRERAVYGTTSGSVLSSSQVRRREFMVDVLKSIGELFKLSVTTVHLSVQILDRYMKKDPLVRDSHQDLLCMISIVLAAKFEEESVDIPTYSTLVQSYDFKHYSKEFLINIEPCVLSCIKYDLSRPTVATFAEYYAIFAVLESDQSPLFSRKSQLMEAVELSLREYLDLSLHEVKLLHYLPSQIAAACLLAARFEKHVETLWPLELSNLTGYPLHSLRNILHTLVSRFEMNGTTILNESGYESSSQPSTPVIKKFRTNQ